MFSKPKIMESFSTTHTSFVIDFNFTNNITILLGDSGTGKTTAFSLIHENAVEDSRILCINYLYVNKDIKKILTEADKKLIVIDNADILLNDDLRKYIAFDEKNQYLIIGRNPKNLMATKDNLFELIREKRGEQLVLKLQTYL